MKRLPISTRMPKGIKIEYDSRSKRVTKTFESAYKAKRFYILKSNQGRNPKIMKEEE